MTMPAGDGAQSGADGGQSATGTGATGVTDGQTAQSGGDASATTTTTTTPAVKTAEQLQAELDAALRRMQAADSNNAKTQAELKKMQDAQLSEAEKTKRDLEAAQKALAERDEAIKQERIKNAFVTDNTYEWHNPNAALKLADLSGVEIADDGTVKNLKDALKAVADANPWMLKPKSGTTTTTGDAASSTTGTTGVGGRGNGSASGADKAGIEKRFPQLKGRVS
jgi:hypothetical protein